VAGEARPSLLESSKQARKKSEADHLILWLIAATFLLGFPADKQADISQEGTANMSFQHNQPGQQVPWLPGPAFPSPSAAPAAGPGQAAPIPPQVLLSAERAGLGLPSKEYNRGAANSRFLTAIGGVGGLIGFISLLLGVPIIIGTLIILPVLIAEPLWTKMFMIGFGVVSLLLFAFFIRVQLRGTSMGGGAFRAWACPNGLVYQQGRQIHALRWEQLGLVYRKMANVNGAERITGYAVQPINAPAFQFSALGGKLAGVASLARPGLRIRTNAGMVINRGGIVYMLGNVDTSAYEGLGELLEEHLVAHQLPLVRDLYQSGQTVAFGKLLIHQQGLSDGTNVMSWEDYHSVAVHDSGYILVYKKPEGTLAFKVTGLPNVALLNAFVGEIRASQRRNSPEHQAENE